MHDQQPVRRIPLGAAAALSALILAASGATAWWGWNKFNSPTTPPPQVNSQSPKHSQTYQPPQGSQSKTIPAQQTVQLYWLKDVDNQIEVVPSSVTVEKTAEPSEALKTAVNSLLAGPKDSSVSTTIPEGTELQSLTIKDDGIHVDLSEEFTSGGGSTSMTGRVAQILYTATSLQPNAKLWLSVEGKQLDVLGGEGLMLEQPLTRQYFENNFDL